MPNRPNAHEYALVSYESAMDASHLPDEDGHLWSQGKFQGRQKKQGGFPRHYPHESSISYGLLGGYPNQTLCA